MPKSTSQRLTGLEFLVLALFFSSGASALVYEVVWSRKLTYVFGGSAFAIATVLAAYMAGLALGSAWFGRRIDRRGHPMLVYGLLEAGIGIWALLLPTLLSGLDFLYAAIYRDMNPGFYPLSLIRFAFCFLLLLVPTTMMGGTLPVLGKLLIRNWGGLGARAGLLYAINTLGAVAGVAAGGFLLLPALGLGGATLVAVAVNAAVAAVAILASRRYPYVAAPVAESGEKPETRAGSSDREGSIRRMVLWVYAASGFAALAYEVVWTKVLALVLGTTTYAFTSMLTTFLLGLSLGALLFGRLVDRYRRPLPMLVAVQIAIAVLALTTVPILESLPQIFVNRFASVEDSWIKIELLRFVLAASTMILPTILMGGTFPLVTRAYADRAQIGKSLGSLYAANTVGAILGSFLTGFVLIPLIGRQNSLLLATLVNLVPAFLLLFLLGRTRVPTAMRWVTATIVVLLIPAAVLGFQRWDKRILSSGAYYYPKLMAESASILDYVGDFRLLYYREATEATISVWQVEHVTTLRINGKIDASSHGDMLTQKLVAHLPALYMSPDGDEDALVIGLASGVSVGALLTHPVRSVETVELIGAVTEAARYFDDYNYRCLDDPRFRLIVNDGRNHLRLTDARYDIIVSQPTNPWIAGVGALFTREYFRLTRERLKPGGLACQWVQIYHMREDDVKAVLATFLDEFPHAHLWEATPGDLILIGSETPLSLDAAKVEHAFAGKSGDDLRLLEVDPAANLLSYYVTDEDGLREFCGAVSRRVTDDNLYLEYAMPRHMFLENELVNSLVFAPVARSPRTLFGAQEPDSTTSAAIDAYDRAHDIALRAHLNAEFPSGIRSHTDAYRRALELAPRTLVARERLSHDYNETGIQALLGGRPDEARPWFTEAVRVGTRPERALAWNNLGYLAYQEGRLDSAEAAWRESRLEEARSPVVNFNLGLLAMRRGDSAEAARRFEESVRYDPDHADALNNAAFQIAESGGDLDRAITLARRAADAAPSAQTLDTLCFVHLKRKEWGAAVRAGERALQLDPMYPDARLHLAESLHGQGRSEEARRTIEGLLGSAPPEKIAAEARELLARIGAATPVP